MARTASRRRRFVVALVVVLLAAPVGPGAQAVVDEQLLLNQSVLNTVGETTIGQYRQLTLTVICGTGVTAGAISFEQATVESYSDPWALIGSPVTCSAAGQHVIHADGFFNAVRARISTAITGGTVTVELDGQ